MFSASGVFLIQLEKHCPEYLVFKEVILFMLIILNSCINFYPRASSETHTCTRMCTHTCTLTHIQDLQPKTEKSQGIADH